MSQDNSEGLDDLQFNLGKIQVISKSITMALKFRPKGQFMLFAGTDKYCWRDCRECEKSREQVGRDLVEKVKLDNYAIFSFSTWALLRKWKRTIHQLSLPQHGSYWMLRKREKTLAVAGSWSASRRDWGRWSGWSRAQVQVHLVKHQLTKPTLSSPTLSTPTSPSPPCLTPPQLVWTFFSL